MAWDVPREHASLVRHLGFKAVQKTPQHWWRLYDPERIGARTDAKQACATLSGLGVRFSWREKPRKEPAIVPQRKPPAAPPQNQHTPHQVILSNPHEDGKLLSLSTPWRWLVVNRSGVINTVNYAEAERIVSYLFEEHGRKATIRPRFVVV